MIQYKGKEKGVKAYGNVGETKNSPNVTMYSISEKL